MFECGFRPNLAKIYAYADGGEKCRSETPSENPRGRFRYFPKKQEKPE